MRWVRAALVAAVLAVSGCTDEGVSGPEVQPLMDEEMLDEKMGC